MADDDGAYLATDQEPTGQQSASARALQECDRVRQAELVIHVLVISRIGMSSAVGLQHNVGGAASGSARGIALRGSRDQDSRLKR